MELLIDQGGAAVNAADKDGHTALTYAHAMARRSDERGMFRATVEALMARGADPSAAEDEGRVVRLSEELPKRWNNGQRVGRTRIL